MSLWCIFQDWRFGFCWAGSFSALGAHVPYVGLAVWAEGIYGASCKVAGSLQAWSEWSDARVCHDFGYQ